MEIYAKVRSEDNAPEVKETRKTKDVIEIEGNTIKYRKMSVGFERVFGEDEKSDDVFEKVAKRRVESLLDGESSTIVTYGQTGTGKTFLMCSMLQSFIGLIPNSVTCLLDLVKHKNEESDNKICTISVQLMEIYHDKLFDLANNKAPVKWNHSNKYIETDAKSTQITNYCAFKTCFEILECSENSNEQEFVKEPYASYTGGSFKKPSKSKKNYLKVEITDELTKKRAQLIFVDLCGNEKQATSQTTGDLLDDAKFNNKNLFDFCTVIMKLGEAAKSHHYIPIPYTEFILTRMLKPCLQRLTQLTMIVTMNMKFQNETLATLRFASNCKRIRMPIISRYDMDARKSKGHVKNIGEEKNTVSGVVDYQMREKNKDEYIALLEKRNEELEKRNEELELMLHSQQTSWQNMMDELLEKQMAHHSPDISFYNDFMNTSEYTEVTRCTIAHLLLGSDDNQSVDNNIINVHVKDADKWEQYSPYNEVKIEKMKLLSIIPNMDFIVDLNADCARDKMITFAIRFDMINDNIYQLKNGEWTTAKKTTTDTATKTGRLYLNGNGWHLGKEWIIDGLSFSNLRVVNNEELAGNNTVSLALSKLYQPIIYCIEERSPEDYVCIGRWTFEVLRFIANTELAATRLKYGK